MTPNYTRLFWIKAPTTPTTHALFTFTGDRMVSQEELFRQRALEAGEMAKSAEATGFKEIAAAYRRAEMLWLDMAEQ